MRRLLLAAVLLAAAPPAAAQKAPEVGYAFPPGGRAGTTVEVQLGGYDWTPDVEVLVYDRRVRVERAGPISPILVPPPPYWFGLKSYTPALPLPRELPVRLTLPADLPPGPVRWSAATAGGAAAAGVFVVGDGPEAIESRRGSAPQRLPGGPITVSGRLGRIAEVDRYRFAAPAAGPLSCAVTARRLGSDFHAVLEIRDARGRLIAEAADPEGRDAAALTFLAKPGEEYEAAVYDLDFRGDFSYTYRLAIGPGPGPVAAVPAAGRPGEVREVELRGPGLPGGALRATTRFPAAPGTREVRIATPQGPATALLLAADVPQATGGPIPVPGGITAWVGGPDGGRHRFTARKGEALSLRVRARELGSPVDAALTLLGPDGARLARNDDLPGTSDAGLEWIAPADGEYTAAVEDLSGRPGSSQAVYHLAIERQVPGFDLRLPAQFALPAGEKRDLVVAVTRRGGFAGPIALSLEGLPEGLTLAGPAMIPVGAAEAKVTLVAAADAPAVAALVGVVGTADLGAGPVSRPAWAPALGLAARAPEEHRADRLALAVTLKPRWKADVVDKDGGHRTPRGATYLAEVTVDRLDGYTGDLVLQMAARQSYQVQGIHGPDLPVPVGPRLLRYPCFMPEWLETSRTSRMILTAVGKVADGRGNVRWLLTEVDGRITMSMEGALLKLAAEDEDLAARPGGVLPLRLRVQRSPTLTGAVRLEVIAPEGCERLVTLEPAEVRAEQEAVSARLRFAADPRLAGDQEVTVRAVALRDGHPVVSQVALTIRFPEAR